MCGKRLCYIYFLCAGLLLCNFSRIHAQGCPPNIGFEKFTFENWEPQLGSVDSFSGVHLSPGFSPTRQKLYRDSGRAEFDRFGQFPVNCPNGSGASIRLGNDVGGAQAEGVNYTFEIPANKNTFSLIYYYAVVMQNPPHSPSEQPKFTAKVFNVTKGEYITCSSFEYIAQQGLPGFIPSALDQTVLTKSWTPVTIKLSGLAGNMIRLEFATNDCTRGGHFGYAYVDVDENCLSPVLGNVVCRDDSNLKLTAPYGFQSYRWFNGDYSSILGTGQTLKEPAIPPNNSEYAVELTPYPDQGCLDTVRTTIRYSTDNIVINAPQALVSGCENQGVNLDSLVRQGSTPDLYYSFYYDSQLQRHVFSTDSITESGIYYVKGMNEDGCYDAKPVNIVVNPMPAYSTVINPGTIVRPGTLDLGDVLSVGNSTLSYWKDAGATIPISDPSAITQNGTYYIKITSAEGCSVITSVTIKFENPPPLIPNAFSPNGDGIHDTWIISNLEYWTDVELNVYSRAGQLVFHSKGYAKPWDGRQNGVPLPVGVYYYVMKLTSQYPAIGGSVTILK